MEEERNKSGITRKNIQEFIKKVSQELVKTSDTNPEFKEALLDFAKDSKGIAIDKPEEVTIKQQKILGEINKIFSSEIKKLLPKYNRAMPKYSEYETIDFLHK